MRIFSGSVKRELLTIVWMIYWCISTNNFKFMRLSTWIVFSTFLSSYCELNFVFLGYYLKMFNCSPKYSVQLVRINFILSFNFSTRFDGSRDSSKVIHDKKLNQKWSPLKLVFLLHFTTHKSWNKKWLIVCQISLATNKLPKNRNQNFDIKIFFPNFALCKKKFLINWTTKFGWNLIPVIKSCKTCHGIEIWL